jgi:hypothetical protein
MNPLKEQLLAIYNSNFIGETLLKLDIQMITDEYLEYEEGKVWLTEGGVELKTEDKTISFTYDLETFQFLCAEDSLLSYLADFDYYSIELLSYDYASIVEEKISDLKVNWIKLVETDYKGEIHAEEEYPIEFIFTFENGSTLQIASISTKINPETGQFSTINYALEGNVLISINRIFDIQY